MKIKTFNPAFQVTLFKTIKRTVLSAGVPSSQRFNGTGQSVDLTPYLGDGSRITTSKSVREAAGAFSLTLLDKPFLGYQDAPAGSTDSGVLTAESIYGVIEPMDVVEIRMQRSPDTSAGAPPPIVMRGLVSNVGRSITMGADGRPQRSVKVSGQDYGKLWQQLQILYLPGYVVGQDTISAFKLFERFGIGFETSLSGASFVSQVLDKVLNSYLANMFPPESPAVKTIVLDDVQLIRHGTTSVTGPQNHEGTIYDLLRTYLDVGPWNELFLEDREDGVYLVCRPNPYKAADGTMIDPDQHAPDSIAVDGEALLSLEVARTDANVANYYWVRAPRFELVDDTTRRLWAVTTDEASTVLLGDYPNVSDKLYGIRAMSIDSQMGGDDVQTFNSGLPEAQKTERETTMLGWITDRRRLIVDINKDNILFERGGARLRGDERLRAGSYMKLTLGTFEAEYYIVQVMHDFMPFHGFFTTLSLDRGTGFIERAKREGGKDSPYYSELVQP